MLSPITVLHRGAAVVVVARVAAMVRTMEAAPRHRSGKSVAPMLLPSANPQLPLSWRRCRPSQLPSPRCLRVAPVAAVRLPSDV